MVVSRYYRSIVASITDGLRSLFWWRRRYTGKLTAVVLNDMGHFWYGLIELPWVVKGHQYAIVDAKTKRPPDKLKSKEERVTIVALEKVGHEGFLHVRELV